MAISDFKGEAWKVALQADGKIVVLGNTNKREPALVRYNFDGTPDTTFGTAGTGQVVIAGENILVYGARRRGFAIQPDGKILVAANAFPYNMTSSE
jgi:uncharacterized delta-60 repeat protein